MPEENVDNFDKKIKPVLNIEFLSHGTLDDDDIEASRRISGF